MLRKNSGLRVLNLGLNTELGAAGVAAVVAGLAENEGLDMLSLSETGLNATGAKALADGLRTNPHTENLYLDGNEIGDEGAAFPGPWKAGFNAPEKKLEEELVERRKGEL